MGPNPVPVLSDEPVHLVTDATPRPSHCYDPTTPPYRDEQGVHVYDHRTIRGLLRDPNRVTSDVSEMLTDEQRERLHPVSAFVWATDRRTFSGCPGRHAALRSVMAPWYTVHAAAARQAPLRAAAERVADGLAAGPFDLHDDYALPLTVDYLADWLGVHPEDVVYAIDDQLAAGRHVRHLAGPGAAGPGRPLPRADGAPGPRTGSPRPRATSCAPASWASGRPGGSSTRSPSARWPPPRRSP